VGATLVMNTTSSQFALVPLRRDLHPGHAADSPLRAVSNMENQMPNAWTWARLEIGHCSQSLNTPEARQTQDSTMPNLQSLRRHKVIRTLALSPDKSEEVHLAI
jgi:hypothetical protein